MFRLVQKPMLIYSALSLMFILGVIFIHGEKYITLFDGLFFTFTTTPYDEILLLNNKIGLFFLFAILFFAITVKNFKHKFYKYCILILFILLFVFFFPTKLVNDFNISF